MTEPQTIATALSAQLIINRVFHDQLSDNNYFYDVFIIAPFKTTDFVSLHNHIIESEPLSQGNQDTLKRIKRIALKNIELFNKIQDRPPCDKMFSCYEIYSDHSINRTFEEAGKQYSNNELFRYCDMVQDLLNSYLPKDAPVKNFIDHLVMDENKKQQFADHLKSKYSDLTGKDLAIMFYAAKEYIKLRNLKALLEAWQQFIDRDIKRDEAMSKAMRTLKNFPLYYDKELTIKQAEIQTIYKSIE